MGGEDLGIGDLQNPFVSSEDETPRSTDGPLVFARGEREGKNCSFVDTATQLCGQCALLLGWRPAEFWDSTPAELACVLGACAPQCEVPPDAADVQKLMELFPDG